MAASTRIPASILDYSSQYVAWVGNNFETCTVVSPDVLCTFAHDRSDWQVGDSKTVTLYNREVRDARVMKIDTTLDVIWLRTSREMCEVGPDTNLPTEGKSYFMIGHSGRQLLDDPRAVRDGIFCSTRITERGHVIGSSGSSKGDSGAPVFWKTNGCLVGMNVGCESIPVERDSSGSCYIGENPRCYVVPVSSLLLPLQSQ